MKKYTPQEIHELVIKLLATTLGVDIETLTSNTAYNSHPQWDSLKHLEIVNNLEQMFTINLTMDDMVEMDTIKKIEEIVIKHLGQ